MIYVFVVFIIIALRDLKGLIKSNRKKEFKVTLSMMIIAFILSTLYALDYRIPSPMVALDKFVSDVLGLGY
ncbi:hypothetical protein RBU61_02305 [Tissierella sp. MB52-C2]|uniref:hypothetical protein n=1 Tax=Tissierella sp. MB52-C2 TaxID=3070999 RepID=UPI00280B5709|nr:hypothetical protein [Tissierella sp. MB52-C2]WMM25516.1 hypothetical protein RBU61_02305 [Tissierella sp. MB52-C2]